MRAREWYCVRNILTRTVYDTHASRPAALFSLILPTGSTLATLCKRTFSLAHASLIHKNSFSPSLSSQLRQTLKDSTSLCARPGSDFLKTLSKHPSKVHSVSFGQRFTLLFFEISFLNNKKRSLQPVRLIADFTSMLLTEINWICRRQKISSIMDIAAFRLKRTAKPTIRKCTPHKPMIL